MVVALMVDGGVRDGDLDKFITISLSFQRAPGPIVSGVDCYESRDDLWKVSNDPALDLAGDVLLHSVGYLDQPPPRLLEE
jgi:hypothetical protein